MTALLKQKMSADEFLVWAARQPDKWELIDGVPVAMSPERVVHGDIKYRVARALDREITSAKLPCRFVLDSAAVRIDASNSYQPDVMVYCGEALSPDALVVPNPLIVVEVLSPSNALRDLRDKLAGYFTVESIAHYLIVDPDKRMIIHHQRRGGEFVTHIVREGVVRLDPPGMGIALEKIFGPTHTL